MASTLTVSAIDLQLTLLREKLAGAIFLGTTMDINRNCLEPGLGLAMLEVQLAGLLVDYRDRPGILKKLQEQREVLLELRHRLENA